MDKLGKVRKGFMDFDGWMSNRAKKCFPYLFECVETIFVDIVGEVHCSVCDVSPDPLDPTPSLLSDWRFLLAVSSLFDTPLASRLKGKNESRNLQK